MDRKMIFMVRSSRWWHKPETEVDFEDLGREPC